MALQISCKKQDKYPGQTLPNIITVNPTSAIPGSPVDIKGQNLKSVTAVRFGTVEAIFDTPSDTSITAIVPDSLPAGDLYVQVYVGDGVAYAAQKFTIIAAPKIPTISSVSPETAYPGDVITIKGINFTAVSSVTFGSTPAVYTITDSTKLNITVPDVSSANQLITVSAPTGSDTVSFNVNLAPVIASIDPSSAHEGDLITVNGVRFTDASSVQLGSTDVTFTLLSDTQLTFTVPVGASSGAISITTPNGTGTSSTSLSILQSGLALPIYDDAITTNWNGWVGDGWGGTKNYTNTSPVESGSHSVEIDYVGGYGSPMQLGGASVAVGSYTSFKISIYGAPGSGGKQINLGINQQDKYTITVVEGQWTDYQISLSDLGLSSSTPLTDIWLKEYSGVGGFSVYVDNMGLN
ncbi:MAG: hypothetical protein JO072_13835 [Parafilimonas sp.]|nr:hypothetical protein [Parafilimonas sp.]